MTMPFKTFTTFVAVVVLSALAALPASAKCTRLAFSVNDYGKEEPARDAKKMLDKYIADWTGERGISQYKTGPKSVDCKLFLDFVVFDEYTCRAEATVCWNNESPTAETAEAEPAEKEEEKVAETPEPSKPSAPASVAATPPTDPAPAHVVKKDVVTDDAKDAVVVPTSPTPSAPAVETTTRAAAAPPAPTAPDTEGSFADKAPAPKNAAALKGSTIGESFSNLSSSTADASKIPLAD